MSVVDISLNVSSFKPVTNICYDNNLVTSQGVFLGDDPFLFSFPTLLVEMSLIFLSSSMVHCVLQRLGQPKVISQLVTGILLGSTFMGRNPEFAFTVFPSRGTFILDTLSLFGLVLFLFDVGVKTDLGLLRKADRRDVAIAGCSSLVPLALVCLLLLAPHGPEEFGSAGVVVHLALRLCLSSFPVISEALEELGLLNSDLGRAVMSSTLIADVASWALIVLNTTVVLVAQMKTPKLAAGTCASMVAFALLVVYVVHPVAVRFVKRAPPGDQSLGEGTFVVLMLAAMTSAFVTELAGYHPVLGAIFLGIMIPGGVPIGATLRERLHPYLELFVPLYLVLAGYRTVLSDITEWEAFFYVQKVFVICYVGKIAGTVGAALYFKTPLRDAITMGFMLNIKGITEVWYFNTSGDAMVFNSAHFSFMILSLLVSTSITTMIVKFIYDPTIRYVATKRRTVQHAKRHTHLRILACVHNEDHVAPLIDLLEAAYPSARSPLSLHLLHLTELVGRASSVLRPYKNRRSGSNSASSSSSSSSSLSDRIFSAFRYFEQQHPCGAVSIHPFIAISPVATMHNDVCSLALSSKCHLAVLPFHKHSDGTRETGRASLQNLNRNVLDFAPCSVAILVDRGGSIACAQTNNLLQRAVVYFLGGADDREALAVAMRMAEGEVAVTVVRFRSRNEGCEAADEQAVEECRSKYEDSEGVVFIEKTVADGEGTVAVMMGMNEKFDIVIVGRRKGMDSALTSGLSAWSEYPELGTLGDTLTTTEFGAKMSILVVQQQQERVGMDGGDLKSL